MELNEAVQHIAGIKDQLLLFTSSKLLRCRLGSVLPDSHDITEYDLDLHVPKQPTIIVPSAVCITYAICLKNYCPSPESKSIEEQVDFAEYQINYFVHPISIADKSISRHSKMKSLLDDRNHFSLLAKDSRLGDQIYQTANSGRTTSGIQFFCEKTRRGLTPSNRDEPLWKDISDNSFASKHKESAYALNITLHERSQLSDKKKVSADRANRFENNLRQELKLIEKRYKSGEVNQHNSTINSSAMPKHSANLHTGNTKQDINRLLENWGQSKPVDKKINFDSKMFEQFDIQPEIQKGSQKKSDKKPPRDSNLLRYEDEEGSLQKRRMNRKAKIQNMKNNLSMVETVPPDLVSKLETVEYEVSDGDLTSRDSMGRQLFRDDLHSDRAHHKEYRMNDVTNLSKCRREPITVLAKPASKPVDVELRSRSNGKQERSELCNNYELERFEDSDQVRISLGKVEVQSSRTQNIPGQKEREREPLNEAADERKRYDKESLESFCLKMESKLDLLKRVSRRSEWSYMFGLMKSIYSADLEREKNSQAHEIVRLLAESVYGKMSKKILDFLFDYKFVQVIQQFSRVIEKHIYLKYARKLLDGLKVSKGRGRSDKVALNTNIKVLLIIKGLIKKKEVTYMQTAFSKMQEKATLVAFKTVNMMRKMDSVVKNIRQGFMMQTFDVLYVNSRLWRVLLIFNKYLQLLAFERLSKFAKSGDLLGCTASDISLRDDHSTRPCLPPQQKYPLSNYINRAEPVIQVVTNKKSVVENLNQILNFRAKNAELSEARASSTLENIRNELSNNPVSHIADHHNLSKSSKTSVPDQFNYRLDLADDSNDYKTTSEKDSKLENYQAEQRWLENERTEVIGGKEDRLFKNKMIDDLITHPDSQTNRGRDEDFGNYEYDLIEFDTFKKKSIQREDEDEFRLQEKSYPCHAQGHGRSENSITEFSQVKSQNDRGAKNKTFNEALQKVKAPLQKESPENCFEDRSEIRTRLDSSKQEIIEKMNLNLNEIEKIFKTQEFMMEFKMEASGDKHAGHSTSEDRSNTGTKFSRGFNYLDVSQKNDIKSSGPILEEESYLLNPNRVLNREKQSNTRTERDKQPQRQILAPNSGYNSEVENRMNNSVQSNGNKSVKSNGSVVYSKTQLSFQKFFEAHKQPEQSNGKTGQPKIPFKDKVVEIRNSSLVIKLKDKKTAFDDETKRKLNTRDLNNETLEDSKKIRHPPKQPRNEQLKIRENPNQQNEKIHSSMVLTKYKDKMTRIVFGDQDDRPKSGYVSTPKESGNSSGKKLPFIKIKENARKISSHLKSDKRKRESKEEDWNADEVEDDGSRNHLGVTNRSNRTNLSGSAISNSSSRLNNRNADYRERFDEEVRSKLRHNSYTKKAEAKSKYSTGD